MSFKPGLELIEASFFDIQSHAIWSVTFIEGPKREDQFSLRTTTFAQGHIRSHEIEVITPLFPEFNNAAHEGEGLVSLVGRERIEFTMNTTSKSPWTIDTSPQKAVIPNLTVSGAIHPCPDNNLKVFIEFNFQNLRPTVLVTARRLADGFLGSAAWLVVMLGGGMFLAYGGFLWQHEKESARTDALLRMALETCTHFTTDIKVELSAKGKMSFGERILSVFPKIGKTSKCSVHQKR